MIGTQFLGSNYGRLIERWGRAERISLVKEGNKGSFFLTLVANKCDIEDKRKISKE